MSPASVTTRTRGPRRIAAISPIRARPPEPTMSEGVVLKVKGGMCDRPSPKMASRRDGVTLVPVSATGTGLILEFLYRIHPVRVERHVLPDPRHRGMGLLVAPYGVLPLEPARGHREIGRVALVGAMAGVVGPLEEVHSHVGARNVLNR